MNFLQGKTPKALFLSLRFNDQDPLHDLGRLMQHLLTEGKEISAEVIWQCSKSRKILGTYLHIANLVASLPTDTKPIEDRELEDRHFEAAEQKRMQLTQVLEAQAGKKIGEILAGRK